MKIAHISDLHVDHRARMGDIRRVLYAFIDEVVRADADLIVISGDMFDRTSTPLERNVLADWLVAAADVAPVFGCKGNHDAAADLDIYNKLDSKNPILIVDRPPLPGGAFVWNLGPAGRVALIALPWADKAHLVAGLEATVDAEASRQLTIQAARDLLVGLRSEASAWRKQGVAVVLATHWMLGGSVVSSGQTIIGTTVELSPSDFLDVGASYVAAGHVHAHQSWFDGRVAYAGSPWRTDFGEREDKGFCLVTLDDEGAFVSNEFIQLPARRMEFYEFSPGDVVRIGDVVGALVRVRIHVKAEDLHLVDEEACIFDFKAGGAEEVVVETVVEHSNRVRSAEISAAATTWEKADAYFRAKNVRLEDAQRERLQSKLGDLERAHA